VLKQDRSFEIFTGFNLFDHGDFNTSWVCNQILLKISKQTLRITFILLTFIILSGIQLLPSYVMHGRVDIFRQLAQKNNIIYTQNYQLSSKKPAHRVPFSDSSSAANL
jgi:hypothetical protein